MSSAVFREKKCGMSVNTGRRIARVRREGESARFSLVANDWEPCDFSNDSFGVGSRGWLMINSARLSRPQAMSPSSEPTNGKFLRGLGLLDSTMLVAGSMIGSGI